MYDYSRAPASSSPSRRSSGHVGIPALAPPRPRGHAAARTTTSAPAPATTNDAAAAAEGASFVFSSLPSPASLVCVSKEEADTASPSRRTSVFSRVGTRVGRADGVVKPVRADPGALGLGSGVGFGVGAGRGASWSLGRRRTASDQSRSAWSTPAGRGRRGERGDDALARLHQPRAHGGGDVLGGHGRQRARDARSAVVRLSCLARGRDGKGEEQQAQSGEPRRGRRSEACVPATRPGARDGTARHEPSRAVRRHRGRSPRRGGV